MSRRASRSRRTSRNDRRSALSRRAVARRRNDPQRPTRADRLEPLRRAPGRPEVCRFPVSHAARRGGAEHRCRSSRCGDRRAPSPHHLLDVGEHRRGRRARVRKDRAAVLLEEAGTRPRIAGYASTIGPSTRSTEPRWSVGIGAPMVSSSHTRARSRASRRAASPRRRRASRARPACGPPLWIGTREDLLRLRDQVGRVGERAVERRLLRRPAQKTIHETRERALVYDVERAVPTHPPILTPANKERGPAAPDPASIGSIAGRYRRT